MEQYTMHCPDCGKSLLEVENGNGGIIYYCIKECAEYGPVRKMEQLSLFDFTNEGNGHEKV